MTAAEKEKIKDLVRSIHEISGASVMLLSESGSQIMTYPGTPGAFCEALQNHMGLSESDEQPLRQKILQHIADNLAADLSVQTLCRSFAVSKSELYRILRTQAPDGVATYVRKLRVSKACRLLRGTTKPMWKIAAEVGYENPDYFLRVFKKEVGMCAGKYRKGNTEE